MKKTRRQEQLEDKYKTWVRLFALGTLALIVFIDSHSAESFDQVEILLIAGAFGVELKEHLTRKRDK